MTYGKASNIQQSQSYDSVISDGMRSHNDVILCHILPIEVTEATCADFCAQRKFCPNERDGDTVFKVSLCMLIDAASHKRRLRQRFVAIAELAVSCIAAVVVCPTHQHCMGSLKDKIQPFVVVQVSATYSRKNSEKTNEKRVLSAFLSHP